MNTTTPILDHPAGVSTAGDELCLNGWTLRQLAARAGQTPFYAYLRSELTAQVARLRRALPEGARLYYSSKANPLPALAQHLSGLVDGFDVASIGELRVALDAGVAAGDCLFTGPGKTPDEIRAAVACEVVVNIESGAQLRATARAADALGKRPRLALRLNCDFAPTRPYMKDHGGTQFGVDVAEAPALLAEMKALGLPFEGFHGFWGSQFFDPRAIAEAQRRAYRTAMSLAPHAPNPPRFVNVGGGFGARFFEDEQPLDLAATSAAIRGWTREVDAGGPALVFEFGRYLVSGCGYYVCQVIDRKTIAGETFLVVDGGLHHHLLGTGSFGQSDRRNFVVLVGDKIARPADEEVHIVGRLCSVMDRFASAVRLPHAVPGDYLVLPNSGAYGASLSPQRFLSHPPAVEMLV